jgi:hypothetical protein
MSMNTGAGKMRFGDANAPPMEEVRTRAMSAVLARNWWAVALRGVEAAG